MADMVTLETYREMENRKNKRIEELEQENKLLGERCNQLLKDKGDLTDQIADIKANCDLAIEGRDIKIMELEQKLEQTEKDLADYQFNYPKIKELETENNKLLDVINNQDVKIADLEKQIEKMKCCENCVFFKEKTYQICHDIKKNGLKKCAFYKMV